VYRYCRWILSSLGSSNQGLGSTYILAAVPQTKIWHSPGKLRMTLNLSTLNTRVFGRSEFTEIVDLVSPGLLWPIYDGRRVLQADPVECSSDSHCRICDGQ